MRPILKQVVWERVPDGRLRVLYDQREELLIGDPDGDVERLLSLLRDGELDVAGLARAMGHPGEDIEEAVRQFDDCGLIEDRDRLGTFGPEESERYFSNLAFFEMFGSLRRSREDLQWALRRSHVLVLGTGGLNSNTIPHLCGLGVGRLTLLDRDTVDVRNFARQYLYRWDQIGDRKVGHARDWVRRFDPTIEVTALDAEVTGPDSVTELLDRDRPDVVMSGVDRPDGVDDWVNEACVRAGVPMVRGGIGDTVGVVWSCDPGRSGCWGCRPGADLSDDPLGALRTVRNRRNRGAGPVAGLLGSLCAFEVLRYITRYEDPVYASNPAFIDFAHGCDISFRMPWKADPDCVVCGRISPAPPAVPSTSTPT